MLVEGVLHAPGGVNGVRRFIRRADQIARRACAAHQAARADERASAKTARSGGVIRVVDALKGSRPSVLCEIVVVETKTGANYRLPAAAGRVGDAKARRDLLAIVARYAGHNRNLQCL